MLAELDRSPALTLALRAVDLANSDPAAARRTALAAITAAEGAAEPVAVASRAMGVAALAGGDLRQARDHLERAIATADGAGIGSGETRGTLAYVLTLQGETAAALQLLDQAAVMLTGAPAARLCMQRALVLSEIGRLEDSAAAFENALTLLRATGGGDLLEADIRTNRSTLFTQQRDWRSAASDLDRAQELYSALGHVGRTALVHHNRGLAQAARGDVPAALAAYDLAEQGYRSVGRSSGLLPVERAETLLAALLLDEARGAAEEAVTEFARQHNQVDLVQARLLLARAALLIGDSATARRESEQARRSAHRQLRPGWAALAGYLSLRARWADGERTDSLLRAGRRTVAQLVAAGWDGPAQDTRLIVARCAMDLGRPATARRQLARVRRSATDGPAETRAQAWHAEALLRLADADLAGAGRAAAAGIGVVEDFQASMGATELRVQASGLGGELATLGLTLALQSGRPEAVLTWAERCRAGAVRLRPARPPDALELSQDLAELRQVVHELGLVEERDDRTALLKRQVALELSIRQQSRHTRPNGPAAGNAPPSAAVLRSALDGRVLVEFVNNDGLLFAVTLTAETLCLHQLAATEHVDHELEALHYGLRRLAYRMGNPASLTAAAELVDDKARRLDALLLGPLRPAIGTAQLVIVPTGGLHAMPWSILPSCHGRPVSVAPSARLWQRAAADTLTDAGDRTRAATQPAAGSIAAGDQPVLIGGPGLPHAAAEVRALARTYPGAELLTGRRAGVDAATAALDGAALAHIAAHGRFRADNPQFSAIELADGPLTVFDLEGLSQAPRHVVLSACESGRPAVRAGDEVMGLAAALLSLGTRSLVATVVPVPDDASRPLMLQLHRRLRRGQSPAVALAAAQRAPGIARTAESRCAAAGFVCFGAG